MKSAVKISSSFSEQDSEKEKPCVYRGDCWLPKLDSQHPSIVQWGKQLNESYSAREVPICLVKLCYSL